MKGRLRADEDVIFYPMHGPSMLLHDPVPPGEGTIDILATRRAAVSNPGAGVNLQQAAVNSVWAACADGPS